MQRNRQLANFFYYPSIYICVAFVLGCVEWISAECIQIQYNKVKAGVIFLSGLYLFLHYPFVFIQKKYKDRAGFMFLILMMLKFSFALVFLFLFLNPKHIENKREILLFLMNYFVLMVTDLAIKMHLMK